MLALQEASWSSSFHTSKWKPTVNHAICSITCRQWEAIESCRSLSKAYEQWNLSDLKEWEDWRQNGVINYNSSSSIDTVHHGLWSWEHGPLLLTRNASRWYIAKRSRWALAQSWFQLEDHCQDWKRLIHWKSSFTERSQQWSGNQLESLAQSIQQVTER